MTKQSRNSRPYHFKDRELSKNEKAVIVGMSRMGATTIEMMGVLELRQETIEAVLENYFGKKKDNKHISFYYDKRTN